MTDPPDLLTDPLPPQRPLERFTQLEADTFCQQCGYNLHGQPVNRDQRLGLLLVRCPECGRHHPAGHQTTASSIWTSRFAATFLVFWVLIVLSVVVTAAITFGALHFLPIEIFTESAQMDAAGREIEYRQLTQAPAANYGHAYIDTGLSAPQPIYRARFTHRKTETAWDRRFALGLLHLFNIGSGLVAGILLVVFLWHWKRRRYYWTLLLPLLAGAYVMLFVLMEDYYLLIRSWALSRTAYYTALQCAGLCLGILIGRPIARTLSRMFIPPKARQHLAFLWSVDGKQPPPARLP